MICCFACLFSIFLKLCAHKMRKFFIIIYLLNLYAVSKELMEAAFLQHSPLLFDF